MNKSFIILFILLFPVIGNYMITQECPEQQSSWSLRFLYANRVGSAIRGLFTNNRVVSTLVGKFADTRVSKYAIPLFKYSYNVQINEAELVEPINEFKSLNDFFKRRLKPEARPFDHDPAVLCSPADGYVWYAPIDENLHFQVKNATFTLTAFLDSNVLAQDYNGGTIIIVRIAPHHYHRFHAPCKGVYSPMDYISGKYESVNMISYMCGVPVLQQNERGIIKMQDTSFGQMLMIPVGALCVGRIKTTYAENTLCKKGADLGFFEFGGSTVVLVLQKDALEIDSRIRMSLENGNECEVRVGQRIAVSRLNLEIK